LDDLSSEEKTGKNTVACGGVVEKDHMPRLLAAERIAVGHHLLKDVAVTDRGGAHIDSFLLHGLKQPEVAHDRRHKRISAEFPALL